MIMTFPIYFTFIAIESPWRFFCSLEWFWFNHMGVLAKLYFLNFLWANGLKMSFCSIVHESCIGAGQLSPVPEQSWWPFLHGEVEKRDFCTLLTYSCWTKLIKAQELCLGCSREKLQPAYNLLLHTGALLTVWSGLARILLISWDLIQADWTWVL